MARMASYPVFYDYVTEAVGISAVNGIYIYIYIYTY